MFLVAHKDGTVIKLKQLYVLDQGSTSGSSLSHYIWFRVENQFRCKVSFPTKSFYSILSLYNKDSTSRWHYLFQWDICCRNKQLTVGMEPELFLWEHGRGVAWYGAGADPGAGGETYHLQKEMKPQKAMGKSVWKQQSPPPRPYGSVLQLWF